MTSRKKRHAGEINSLAHTGVFTMRAHTIATLALVSFVFGAQNPVANDGLQGEPQAAQPAITPPAIPPRTTGQIRTELHVVFQDLIQELMECLTHWDRFSALTLQCRSMEATASAEELRDCKNHATQELEVYNQCRPALGTFGNRIKGLQREYVARNVLDLTSGLHREEAAAQNNFDLTERRNQQVSIYNNYIVQANALEEQVKPIILHEQQQIHGAHSLLRWILRWMPDVSNYAPSNPKKHYIRDYSRLTALQHVYISVFEGMHAALQYRFVNQEYGMELSMAMDEFRKMLKLKLKALESESQRETN